MKGSCDSNISNKESLRSFKGITRRANFCLQTCHSPIMFFFFGGGGSYVFQKASSGGWDGWWLERLFLGLPVFASFCGKTLYFTRFWPKIGAPQKRPSTHHIPHLTPSAFCRRGKERKDRVCLTLGNFRLSSSGVARDPCPRVRALS